MELTSSSINATKPAFTFIQMDSSLIVQLANNLETEKYYCFVVPSVLCTKKYYRLLSTMLMCSISFFFPCLLTAVKKLVFRVVHTLSIKEMNTDFHSCGVDLASVLVWAILEQRLYSLDIADISDHLILRDGAIYN